MNVEMEESMNRTYQKVKANRPPNTQRNYTSKQNEFKAWCQEKPFGEETRFTVTGAELHLFM